VIGAQRQQRKTIRSSTHNTVQDVNTLFAAAGDRFPTLKILLNLYSIGVSMITAVVGNEPRSRLIRGHYPKTTIRLAEYRPGR